MNDDPFRDWLEGFRDYLRANNNAEALSTALFILMNYDRFVSIEVDHILDNDGNIVATILLPDEEEPT